MQCTNSLPRGGNAFHTADEGVAMAHLCEGVSQLRFAKIAALIGYAVVIAFSPMVRAQSSDLQEKCAMQAKTAFQELGREYAAVLESINVRFEIVSSDYLGRYSTKLNRCLLLIRKTTSLMQELSDTSYLLDANDRKMFALYIETGGKRTLCTLIPTVRQTTPCKSRKEFDAFVSEYIEK
jgi:hypothetical protein